MKLCATISSEKGKEVAKCGNDFITIEVTNEARKRVCSFKVVHRKGRYHIVYSGKDENDMWAHEE